MRAIVLMRADLLYIHPAFFEIHQLQAVCDSVSSSIFVTFEIFVFCIKKIKGKNDSNDTMGI